MKFLAIIQARMGSSRLPGKALLKLGGKTVLEHVVERISASSYVDEVYVATTIGNDDQLLVNLCSEKGIKVYCGSENDVLDRFYQLAKKIKPLNVVRITADCPLIDPEVVDKVIGIHESLKVDYTSNTLKETYPDGQDVEVFTFAALKKAWQEAMMESEREHVTPYIKFSEKFSCENVVNDRDLSDKRWTIDQEEDYIFIQKIFNKLLPEKKMFGMDDILKILTENPDWEKINKSIIRNEGYTKSIKNDKRTDL